MNYKLKSGFTLIEMLVAIGLLGILAVIGSQMFFSILKNTAKTQVTIEVKQNGNRALSVMSRMIRNARSIELDSCTTGSSITIVNPDRESTTFSCTGTRIASESAGVHPAMYLTSEKVAVKSCDITCDLVAEPNFVTISFTLQATGTRIEEVAEVDFNTTVSLRTY